MLVPPLKTGRKLNIMVVDDSAIVRGLIVRQLSQQPNFNVVASLANGEMAIHSIRHHQVDVVVLDIEMPVMDGMSALPQLLAAAPGVRVIMASTLTSRNAEISLRALQLGAADYVPKPSLRDDKDALEKFYHELVNKINALGYSSSHIPAPAPQPMPSPNPVTPPPISSAPTSPIAAPAQASQPLPPLPQDIAYPATKPKALAIASSTGGPQALMDIFRALKGKLEETPIFVTQHMPRTFTKILSEHLAQACGRDCHEGIEGERVENGKIYLAPGDYHMVPKLEGGQVIIHLNQEPEVNFCRPAADPMIEGLVDAYGEHLMLLVLTGMGHDGLNGARKLSDKGGTIIAQDKESSVVWGMPRAVADHKLCKAVLPLDRIPSYLTRAFGGGMS